MKRNLNNQKIKASEKNLEWKMRQKAINMRKKEIKNTENEMKKSENKET